MRKVAVLGCGNGAQTCAADQALAGYEVNLYELPEFRKNLDPIIEKGGIEISGAARNGFAKLAVVTTDIREAIEGAELIQIVVPAYGHGAFSEACAPHLEDGQTVVFYGKGGAGVNLANLIKNSGSDRNILVGETNTLPYGCKIVAPGRVQVYDFVKSGQLMLAAFPGTRTPNVFEKVKNVCPWVTPCENVIETILHDWNAIVHPATVLLNAGRIEYSRGEFFFFTEGVTPSVAKVIEAIDKERLAILKAFGLTGVSLLEGIARDCPRTLHSVHEALTLGLEGFSPLKGPYDLGLQHARHLTEDVPFGLVTFSSIANLVSVKTDLIDSAITLASALLGMDYWETGRTVEKLGLANLDKDRLVRYVNTGS